MKNNKESSSGASGAGVGFFGLLGIAFIVLKLLGKITWPWVLVLAPLWIPTAVGVLVLICFVIVVICRND